MKTIALICFLIALILFVSNIVKILDTNRSSDFCLFFGSLFLILGWIIKLIFGV